MQLPGLGPCTYKGCAAGAVEKITRDGAIRLCATHAAEYELALEEWTRLGTTATMRRFLGIWARAHGTARHFTDRMLGRQP